MVTTAPPATIDEFMERHQLEKAFANAKPHYDMNLVSMQSQLAKSEFYIGLDDCLSHAEKDYKQKTNIGPLLTEGSQSSFQFVQKPFASAMDKTLRKNVVWNKRYPNFPDRRNAWIVPSDWFSSFDDLLRGTLVCKYIDGPSFVCERLEAHAKKLSLRSRSASRELEDGYYAHHFYVALPFNYADEAWNEHKVDVEVEIQVTTQLQDAARQLTHLTYNKIRSKPTPPGKQREWKWDYSSARFKAAYLSHALHLLEGMILELRQASAANVDSELENLAEDLVSEAAKE